MDHPLLAKLRHGADLSVRDEMALLNGLGRPREHLAHRDLLRGGEALGHAHVVVQGVACRYMLLPSGRRQILALLVAGDIVDLRPSVLGRPDHGVCSLTPCKLATLPADLLRVWAAEHPRIGQALARAALVDEAVMRQWLVNVGARRVEQRIAHLFLEVLHRLRAVGLAPRDSYPFAVTQDDVGAMVGGSLVHVCRILTQLRTEGAVLFRQGVVKIDDVAKLAALAEFNPAYLHLDDGARARMDVAVARVA